MYWKTYLLIKQRKISVSHSFDFLYFSACTDDSVCNYIYYFILFNLHSPYFIYIIIIWRIVRVSHTIYKPLSRPSIAHICCNGKGGFETSVNLWNIILTNPFLSVICSHSFTIHFYLMLHRICRHLLISDAFLLCVITLSTHKTPTLVLYFLFGNSTVYIIKSFWVLFATLSLKFF